METRRHIRGWPALAAGALLGLSSLGQSPEVTPELVVQSEGSTSDDPVDYSPDGRWIATAHEAAVTIWEASTGHAWRSLLGHSGKIRSVTFSPDGRWLASGSLDMSAVVWEVSTGHIVRRLPADKEPVAAVAFSADGKQLAMGTGDSHVAHMVNGVDVVADYSPRVWDTSTWQQVRLTPPHHGAVDALQFSKDGKYLATTGQSGDIVLWDVATRRQARQWKGHAANVGGLSFSPNGRALATKSGNEIKIWDLSGRLLRTLTHPNRFWASDVKFSPDGRWIASAGSMDVRLWDATTFQQGFTVQGFPSVAFSADSLRLAAQSRGRTVLLDIPSGREVGALGGMADLSGVLAASSDKRWLATGAGKGLKLWDTAAGRETRLLGAEFTVTAAAFTPDGRGVAAGTSDGNIAIWRLPDGAEIRRLRHEGNVAALAFSPDGRWLASGANRYKTDGTVHTASTDAVDHSIRVWEAATGREAHVLLGHTSYITALAFAPNGRSLASAASGRWDNATDAVVRIWDLSTWRESRRLSGHSRAINSIAFSPDSRRIVSASGSSLDAGDSTERVWDAVTGAQLWSATRASGAVTAVAFSPDGRLIASGGQDGLVDLSDADSGKSARRLRAHAGWVNFVAYTSDGRLLLSTSRSDGARIWDASTGKQLALLATHKDTDDWLVAAPNGLFDGTSDGVQDLAVWRIGLRTYSPDRFFTDYYSPRLLARIFAGERPEPPRQVAALKLAPDVQITEPRNTADFRQSPITVRVQAKDLGGGLREVRLYNNGKLVDRRDAGTDRNPVFTFTVELAAGNNRLSATAINAERTESPESTVQAVFTPAAPRGKPVLWVLAVGINQYEDSKYTLRFARPDAEAIANFFQQNRAARLFSDARVVRRLDRDATRAGIKQALAQIAEGAKPEDVMLIYLAGHGIVLGEQFYFLSQEMRGGAGADEEASVRRYGLPATEFADTLRAAKAQKQILVIDACQAGGALTQIAKLMMARGLREAEQMDRATQMLARATGTHLIAAATERQYAMEIPELGHGLLTSVLLNGLGEKGRPEAAASVDGTVTIMGLLQYVNRVVPELTEKYRAGNKQYPVSNTNGMDFPIWAR